MIAQVALAFGLACATVILHALGTLEAITHLARVWQKRNASHGPMASSWQIARIVGLLLLLHLLEAATWGGSYWLFGLLPDFETALYFSITSYTTVGYGDVVLPPTWRLLGPLEAAVGILMFGWSTGIMVAAITRIHGERLRLRLQQVNDDD
ncbi:MAG TPA: potassium channel family protein [Gemmataceae bacterium]|nr:potassium channel family protein [Gemmataceae bacterium]